MFVGDFFRYFLGFLSVVINVSGKGRFGLGRIIYGRDFRDF